jgi:hypothetical protein
MVLHTEILQFSIPLAAYANAAPAAHIMACYLASDLSHALAAPIVPYFARIAAEHLTAGKHHPGVLIALSSRFSRRPSGIPQIATAISAIANQALHDRLVYLEQPAE